ncbi:MAG TPA: glycosyltransferase family 4 protein [Blastocatellia bacterium]|nr:glycosyltransferase family 4 protein [Blastocatellia bacterium]
MRIAIVNHNCNILGGVEMYLSCLIPVLHKLGHEVSFWYEESAVTSRPQIVVPQGVPSWSASELGEERAISALQAWRPDVIYSHGLRSISAERRIQSLAPGIFFAHSYYGTCISGHKTFRRPKVKVCDRQLGWQCFLHYYPRRCGGLNPLVMLKEYRLQADRLNLLAQYETIIVASDHMADEYRKHGLANKLMVVRYHPMCVASEHVPAKNFQLPKTEWRLLFIGRMEFLKGGDCFLEALPIAQRELGVTLHVTFAGDGLLKAQWQARAEQLAAQHAGLKFDFLGWISAERRDALLREKDLIVVPSLGPEPFGLIGLEAGQYGVPSVAFAVGGISQWLQDGFNGFLAAPDDPKERNLATAIVRCLQDVRVYQRLSRGALAQAERFDRRTHMATLLPLLERAASQGAGEADTRG